MSLMKYRRSLFFCLLSAALMLTGTAHAGGVDGGNAIKSSSVFAEPEKQGTDTGNKLFVRMEAGKSRVFSSETVPLTIRLYSSGVRLRDIGYPVFNHAQISMKDFGPPAQYWKFEKGITYHVTEFRTLVFATAAGTFTLGPATLRAEMVRTGNGNTSPDFSRNSYFGNYDLDPVELFSNHLTLRVQPLPPVNRPPDFRGAVGEFSFAIEEHPANLRVGRPFVLKMIVSGEGNFSTVTSPVIGRHAGYRIYKTGSRLGINRKIFEIILMPAANTVKSIPLFSFSFFNPRNGRYRTIVRGGTNVTVSPALITETPDAPSLERNQLAGTERHDRENFSGDKSQRKAKSHGGGRHKGENTLVFLAVAASMLTALSWLIMKRSEISSTRDSLATHLAARTKARKGIRDAEHLLWKNQEREFYDVLFKTLREFACDRFQLPVGWSADGIEEKVRKGDMDYEGIGEKLKNILAACDEARYGPRGTSITKKDQILDDLKEIIRH